MANTALTFTRNADGDWIAKYVSAGKSVVQLKRAGDGHVSVSASLPGMDAVPIASFDNPYSTGEIFTVDVMAGVEVTITSTSEVITGAVMTE